MEERKYLSRRILIHTVYVLWMQVKLIDETNLTVIWLNLTNIQQFILSFETTSWTKFDNTPFQRMDQISKRTLLQMISIKNFVIMMQVFNL